MALFLAMFGMLAATAVAQNGLSSLPPCGQTCISNMIHIAITTFGCTQGDQLCYCKNVNFGYGIRDCADQACPNAEAADTVKSYGLAFCRAAYSSVTTATTISTGAVSVLASSSSSGVGTAAASTTTTAASVRIVTITVIGTNTIGANPSGSGAVVNSQNTISPGQATTLNGGSGATISVNSQGGVVIASGGSSTTVAGGSGVGVTGASGTTAARTTLATSTSSTTSAGNSSSSLIGDRERVHHGLSGGAIAGIVVGVLLAVLLLLALLLCCCLMRRRKQKKVRAAEMTEQASVPSFAYHESAPREAPLSRAAPSEQYIQTDRVPVAGGPHVRAIEPYPDAGAHAAVGNDRTHLLPQISPAAAHMRDTATRDDAPRYARSGSHAAQLTDENMHQMPKPW